MRPGIKINDLKVGEGAEALRDKTVIVHLRMFLNHGTKITNIYKQGEKISITLAQRHHIAGLRYGIEGMRVGGIRNLIKSPHLAYGAKGVPGIIPANAILRFEVKLLEVRESNVMYPDEYQPGKQLVIFYPGEAARNLARWQFGLLENDCRCGASFTYPIPRVHWRHALKKYSVIHEVLDQSLTKTLFENALSLPNQFPKECFKHEELWADHSEPGSSIVRDKYNNSLCLTLTIYEKGQLLCSYYLSETGNAWLSSKLHEVIIGLIKPYLVYKPKNKENA